MNRRPGTSVVLVLGALVLLAAIAVGNSMGSRVIGQIASRSAEAAATPIPLASTPPPDSAASRVLWKRRHVLSIATDPAFPDPRITPEPEIPATPRPRPATPKPKPRATYDLSTPTDEITPDASPGQATPPAASPATPDALRTSDEPTPPQATPTPGPRATTRARGHNTPTPQPVPQPSYLQ